MFLGTGLVLFGERFGVGFGYVGTSGVSIRLVTYGVVIML